MRWAGIGDSRLDELALWFSVVECEMAWSYETMARLPEGKEVTVLAPGAMEASGRLSLSSRVSAERL